MDISTGGEGWKDEAVGLVSFAIIHQHRGCICSFTCELVGRRGASSGFAVSCSLSRITSQRAKLEVLVALEALLRHIDLGDPGGGTPSEGQRPMARSKRKLVARTAVLPFITICTASSLYV